MNIDDIMICPKCKSDNCYVYDMSNTSFEFDYGRSEAHCECDNCGNSFKIKFAFTYDIYESE